MDPRRCVLAVIIAGLVGCGSSDTWVDTLSGDCTEEQLAEMKANPEPYAEMGTRVCTNTNAGEFAGEFRCTGSTEDGTRKMEAKCKR
jgi:hypothetical protein